MPTIMPPNMRFMENAKRSEFNAKISIPMDKNPYTEGKEYKKLFGNHDYPLVGWYFGDSIARLLLNPD